MPIYHIGCRVCEREEDIFRSFRDFDDLPDCCGQKMHRIPCPAMVTNDIQPYLSMVTGEEITSRSRHREHLRDHNCIEVGNETHHLKPKPMTSPPGLKETIIRVANEKLRS